MKNAIICDIDGTLAILGERGVYEHERAHLDYLNSPVYQVLSSFNTFGVDIFIISGRHEEHRKVTEQWLSRYKVPYTTLFLRPKENNERDAKVKRKYYEDFIQGKYNVLFVLEDRNQCVDMWRKELQLPCFQVNYGDF